MFAFITMGKNSRDEKPGMVFIDSLHGHARLHPTRQLLGEPRALSNNLVGLLAFSL